MEAQPSLTPTTPKSTAPSPTPSSAEAFARVLDWKAIEAFRPYLDRIAEGSSGRYATQDILDAINRGAMHLWALADKDGVKLCLVTEFIQWPQRLGLTIFGAVGRDPKSWLAHIDELKRFALYHGASLLCGWMRKGYGRITGWRETHRLYELEIGDDEGKY